MTNELQELSLAADIAIDEYLGIPQPNNIDNIIIHEDGVLMHFENGKYENFDNTFILIKTGGCIPMLKSYDYDKIMKEYEEWKEE